ncbi:hypothetical protein HY639_00970 [Candidatus Woesearchaeota archaeon]|nr:hypothetical protein [Candidatus Woesearchaeota archaeon]
MADDERVNELMRLLRTMEERFTNMNRKLDVIESNFISQQKKMNKGFLLAESDLVEMKKDMSAFTYKLTLMGKELSLCARKGDVDALRKYLELWQPMDFIRRDEAERFIQQKSVK